MPKKFGISNSESTGLELSQTQLQIHSDREWFTFPISTHNSLGVSIIIIVISSDYYIGSAEGDPTLSLNATTNVTFLF